MKDVKSPSGSLLSAALVAITLFCAPVAAFSAVFVSVAIAPPVLPVYMQPVAPGPGYIWTPGYWAYGPDGYYWVPGTWVLAPYIGALWTPGYWGWGGGVYVWHPGYWGPRVGFYGGVNYGFGYIGVGYRGGYWNSGAFYYNRAVTNINVTNIHNTYNETVFNNTTMSRVSYNGGAGGIAAQPTPDERLAERDLHRMATPMQAQHERAASINRAQLASVNHGVPAIAATPRAAAFKDRSVLTTKIGAPGTAAVSSAPSGQNASHVASSHINKDVRLEHGNPHPIPGAVHPQMMPHAQQQPLVTHGDGEHHEEGQRSR
jgi:hypothetical protein